MVLDSDGESETETAEREIFGKNVDAVSSAVVSTSSFSGEIPTPSKKPDATSGRKVDSSVWKYFTFNKEINTSFCTYPNCAAKVLGRNTGNAVSHLKRHEEWHEEYSVAESERKDKMALLGGGKQTLVQQTFKQSLEHAYKPSDKRYFDWLIDRLIMIYVQFNFYIERLPDAWSIDWLIESLIDRLIDWLMGWLIDWSITVDLFLEHFLTLISRISSPFIVIPK